MEFVSGIISQKSVVMLSARIFADLGCRLPGALSPLLSWYQLVASKMQSISNLLRGNHEERSIVETLKDTIEVQCLPQNRKDLAYFLPEKFVRKPLVSFRKYQTSLTFQEIYNAQSIWTHPNLFCFPRLVSSKIMILACFWWHRFLTRTKILFESYQNSINPTYGYFFSVLLSYQLGLP